MSLGSTEPTDTRHEAAVRECRAAPVEVALLGNVLRGTHAPQNALSCTDRDSCTTNDGDLIERGALREPIEARIDAASDRRIGSAMCRTMIAAHKAQQRGNGAGG